MNEFWKLVLFSIVGGIGWGIGATLTHDLLHWAKHRRDLKHDQGRPVE
jgi:hypothetical protein